MLKFLISSWLETSWRGNLLDNLRILLLLESNKLHYFNKYISLESYFYAKYKIEWLGVRMLMTRLLIFDCGFAKAIFYLLKPSRQLWTHRLTRQCTLLQPVSYTHLDVYKRQALEDRRTVNAEWYTTICLPQVIDEIRKHNRKLRIILHHNNASSHTARQTIDYLKEQNIELMSHCPYSPDLSPNDFFLFPNIKQKMRGQRFSSPQEAVESFQNHISEVPTSEWKKCFETWFERMQKCVNLKGEYFGKQ